MKEKNLEDVSLFINYKIMETWLTKNLRTHIVYIRTVDWKDTEEIQITKDQYEIISDDIQNLKANDFYKITDIDTWKRLFEWQRKDILRFKEKNIWNSWYKVFCEYWNKHDLINWWFACDCFQKYWFYAIDLKIWAKNNNKPMYMQDLSEDDKRECWKFLKANNKI